MQYGIITGWIVLSMHLPVLARNDLPAVARNDLPALSRNDLPAAVMDTCPFRDTLIISPGDCGSRYFGDLMIRYAVDKKGTTVTCTLILASQLVGLQTINAKTPTYDFNVLLGHSKASGKLTLRLGLPGSLSALSGDFTYSVAMDKSKNQEDNMMFSFRGDLVGWYAAGTSP